MSAQASVLYDVPGPNGRRRNHILTTVFAVVIIGVAAIALAALGRQGQLDGEMWSPFLEAKTWTTYILPGLGGTILAAVLSILAACILGAVLGIARLSDHRGIRWVAGVIVEVFRAIPVLILITFAYFAFARYTIIPSTQLALLAVVTGLTLYNGTVIAEILRSGILSLPRGQAEAASAIGLRKGQIMRIVLLPQAVTAMLPALVAQMVIALKDSALGYTIGYVEVVRSGLQSASYHRNYLPSLLVVAAVMIILNFALTSFATYLERRIREGKAAPASMAD